MAKLRPGGRACLCRGCNSHFLGDAAFTRHRIGPWEDRRCLTLAERVEQGWHESEHGYWVPPKKKAA